MRDITSAVPMAHQRINAHALSPYALLVLSPLLAAGNISALLVSSLRCVVPLSCDR
jgi:hypothetical protein